MTGDELRAIRKAANLPQTRMAKRLGISARQLINLELGRQRVTPSIALLAQGVHQASGREAHTGILIF